MRNAIISLTILMFLLICNIIAYIISEDYRFFLKKIKYQEEIVYDTGLKIDDTQRVNIIDSSSNQVVNNDTIELSSEKLNFLDELSGKSSSGKLNEELPSLSLEQQELVDVFSDFNIIESLQKTSIFDITTEYPDPYYSWFSEDLTLYIFPTKNYDEVKKIFEVLTFELPFELNEANTVAERSFFINLESQYNDGEVRIVGEYKKNAFGLKIKKVNYNRVKEILDELSSR